MGTRRAATNNWLNDVTQFLFDICKKGVNQKLPVLKAMKKYEKSIFIFGGFGMSLVQYSFGHRKCLPEGRGDEDSLPPVFGHIEDIEVG